MATSKIDDLLAIKKKFADQIASKEREAATDLVKEIKELTNKAKELAEVMEFTVDVTNAAKELGEAVGVKPSSKAAATTRTRVSKEDKENIFNSFLKSNKKKTFLLSELKAYANKEGITFSGSPEQFFKPQDRKDIEKGDKSGVAYIWKKV
jgi:DNA-binding protein H-NS